MTPSPLPVDELLRRAVAGDQGALQTLLERCREFVRLLVRSRIGAQMRQRVDSSDLVQETLLRAAQHIREFNGHAEEEWRAWLGRIAEREVIRQMRRHLGAGRRALAREQGQQPSGDGVSRLGRWFLTQSSPSAAAVRNERALALARVLSGLPDDYREVLILRHLEGLAFPEVASRMGRSPGAVRVLWTRALKKLRDDLQRAEG